ncbi:MAG: cell division protein FtsZ [Bacteroidetes bacterium]|nr:cell division protein FtsZ [Bacteroidota bacterium]
MEFQSLNFDLPKECNSLIKVIGVGGGGSNAVNYMFSQGIKGVDFIVCNTDAQALDYSAVPHKIQLGETLTEGRGAGASPAVGKEAAIESIETVRNILQNEKGKTSMVFVTAGMGGGTGTGAAPIIAKMAKDMGILTVGIITVPFGFEGKKRHLHAEEGVIEMRDAVDTLLIIRNDKLRELFGNLSLKQAFSHADEVLCTAAKGIAEVMTLTGLVNVDMNDVKTVMKDSGVAIMGSGRASGEGRAKRAVDAALESPLLNDSDIFGAKHVLLNITHGEEELLMDEVSDITDAIQDRAGQNANVIWGYGQDTRLGDDISVTVIATGWDAKNLEDVIPGIESQTQVVVDVHTAVEEIPAAPIAVTAPLMQEVIQPIASPVMMVELEEVAPVENKIEEVQTIPLNMELESEPVEFVQNEVAFEIEFPEEPTTIDLFETTAQEVQTEQVVSVVEENPSARVEDVVMKHKESTEVNSNDVFNVIGFSDNLTKEEAPEANMPIRERATDSVDRTTINQLQNERANRIKQVTMQIKSPGGLLSLEEVPAYERKRVVLDSTPASNESQASRFGISEITDANGEKRYELKGNNPFLHDNVD